jgi:hypothetical protein
MEVVLDFLSTVTLTLSIDLVASGKLLESGANVSDRAVLDFNIIDGAVLDGEMPNTRISLLAQGVASIKVNTTSFSAAQSFNQVFTI